VDWEVDREVATIQFDCLQSGFVAVMLASASGAQKASAVNSVSSEEVGSATIPPAPAQFAIMAEPRAPKVTCDKNHWAIAADNSTLGDVLAAVHSCIGVKGRYSGRWRLAEEYLRILGLGLHEMYWSRC